MSLKIKKVLAIETSCDDSSVSIVNEEAFVEALVSQHQDLLHKVYGGVVPEVASRSHSDWVLPLVDLALDEAQTTLQDIDAVAVTSRPGLLGALLVGVVTAKTLAFGLNKPLIAVNHIEGHLMAGFLRDRKATSHQNKEVPLSYPYLALAVSGGHTQICVVHQFGHYEIIGRTRDDAAGEAFDKFAKLVGLGYPGGALVDREAQKAKGATKYEFPMGLIEKGNLDFSFSGLKSSALRLLEGWSEEQILAERALLARDYQEAVVQALLKKLKEAQQKTLLKKILITGGVSANSRLRNLASEWTQEEKLHLYIPPLKYCTDNAAMIGWAGVERLKRNMFADLTLSPSAQSYDGDFVES